MPHRPQTLTAAPHHSHPPQHHRNAQSRRPLPQPQPARRQHPPPSAHLARCPPTKTSAAIGGDSVQLQEQHRRQKHTQRALSAHLARRPPAKSSAAIGDDSVQLQDQHHPQRQPPWSHPARNPQARSSAVVGGDSTLSRDQSRRQHLQQHHPRHRSRAPTNRKSTYHSAPQLYHNAQPPRPTKHSSPNPCRAPRKTCLQSTQASNSSQRAASDCNDRTVTNTPHRAFLHHCHTGRSRNPCPRLPAAHQHGNQDYLGQGADNTAVLRRAQEKIGPSGISSTRPIPLREPPCTHARYTPPRWSAFSPNNY